MKYLTVTFFITGLLLTADDPHPKKDPGKLREDDRSKLQGTWRMISWKQDGRDLAIDDPKLFQAIDIRWSFEGDTITQTGNFQGLNERNGPLKETFQLYPGRNPKWIDTKRKRGRKEEILKGIYAFDGKRLKVCHNPYSNSDERPTEFAANRGSKFQLFEFERVEEKK